MLFDLEKKPRILAVDDEEINLFMIGKILGNDVEVASAECGEDALRFLTAERVDMALLDYNLPDIDGIEVLKSMKQKAETQNIPVIILTAETSVELETEMFRAGASDFIRKPFVPDILRERTRRVLENEYLKRNLQQEVARQTEQVREQMEENQRLFAETVLALAKTIDAKDRYTQDHSRRVAEYSRTIASRAGMADAEVRDIYFMGLLHDIGKIGVPESIINKTDRLTDEEFGVIKTHTTIGSDILKSIVHFPALSIGARSHHERYDGRGYPDGLRGDDIPMEARVIAVADAYDAMTSNRSYRNVMAQERVRAEIERGRGTQFDPAFADIMLSMIDEDKEYRMRDRGGGKG
ncbi:MAG: response regulator [Schwartzia sp.]|nr:response regulator [Schwartzia sp. (in: firmicutes)]